jgi:hypothetical protein
MSFVIGYERTEEPWGLGFLGRTLRYGPQMSAGVDGLTVRSLVEVKYAGGLASLYWLFRSEPGWLLVENAGA